MLFAIVVLDLVLAVLCQEIGWEKRLGNDLLCLVGHKNLNLVNQSTTGYLRKTYLV